MESTMAIVPLSRTEAGPDDRKMSHTPFAMFMAELVMHQAQPRRLIAGVGECSAVPVERVIADGLWLVMLRAAQKASLVLSTEHQVTGLIAPRVERVLDAGILIVYQTPKLAADAFRSQVLQPLECNPQASAKQATSLQEAWKTTSAQFFANILRKCQEYSAEIQQAALRCHKLTHRFTEESLWGPDNTAQYDLALGIADKWKRYLDVTVDCPNEKNNKYDPDLKGAVRALSEMQALARQYKLFGRLPFRTGNIPKRVKADGAVETWLNTQILLAVLEAPDSEYLTADQYVEGRQRVHQLETKTVFERLLQRLCARRAAFDDEDKMTLHEQVKQIISLYMPKGEVVFDLETFIHVFVDVPPERLQVKGSIQSRHDVNSLVWAGKFDPTGEALSQKVDWETLELRQFEQMLEEKIFSIPQFVVGIARMPADRRGRALEMIDESLKLATDPDEAMVADFFRIKDVCPSPGFLRRFAEAVPSDAALACFRQILRNLIERRWTIDTGLLSTCATILVRIPHPVFVEWSGSPQGRLELTRLLHDLYLNPNGLTEELELFTKAIRQQINEQEWGRLILAGHTLIYDDAFDWSWENRKLRTTSYKANEPPAVPWKEVPKTIRKNNSGDFFLDHRWIGLSLKQIKALFIQHEEEEIFRWLYEVKGTRELNVAWRSYLQARADYREGFQKFLASDAPRKKKPRKR